MMKMCRFLLVLGLSWAVSPSFATMSLEINFEADQVSGSEWIHAQANYDADRSQLYDMLNTIVDYPALHGWIRDVRIESDAENGRQEFLIRFVFPWPVGERWSRVEVRRDCGSFITWNQLDGNLKKNQGRITVTGQGQQARIDYQAIIDVGYPDAVTRGYKKQFVSEFLNAIHHRMDDGDRSPGATPAAAPPLLMVTSNP